MANGTVKWFNGQKGYGFIHDEDNNPRFFHARDMRDPGAFNRLKVPDNKGLGGDKVKAKQRFYRDLPIKPGAYELVEYCQDLLSKGKIESLAFLTALPHDYSVPYAAQDKVWWAHERFEGIPVFFGPFSHDKYNERDRYKLGCQSNRSNQESNCKGLL